MNLHRSLLSFAVLGWTLISAAGAQPAAPEMASTSVVFTATAVGHPEDTLIEFILIAPDSGHEYESVAVSHISAEELHQRLMHIGAQPGYPYQPDQLRFTPRGERLKVSMAWVQDGVSHSADAHELILDQTRKDHLPTPYWIYTGSQWLSSPEGDRTLMADARDPGSILSIYNEPETLMDRADAAPKGAVYGTLFPHPDYLIPEGTVLTVTVSRISMDAEFQPFDVYVSIEPRNAKEDYPVTLSIQDPSEGRVMDCCSSQDDVSGALVDLSARYPELFIHPDPSPEVTLSLYREILADLQLASGQAGAVLSPPQGRDLFYKSLLPPPRFRERGERPSQPWEVHIEIGESESEPFSLRLERLVMTDRDPQGQPLYEEVVLDPVDPKSLSDSLELEAYDFPVLLVYAPPAMNYGDLLNLLEPVRDRFDTYYIFLNE